MTEITATYVSASSFKVSGSKLDEFSPGRAVWANCGNDGVKYAFVASASYSSPDTTVTLDSVESQSLTANLASVLFGRVKYGATKGNEPLQNLWTMRGHRNGLGLAYKSGGSDEILINAGSLHIHDGTAENIYACQSQLTKSCSVSGTQWYGVYVDPPDSGLVFTASDIELSSTMPTYDQVKQGWYHPTTTDLRCIGFILAINGHVNWFVANGRNHYHSYVSYDYYAASPSNNWTKVTLNVPVGTCSAICLFIIGYKDYSGYLKWRRPGISGWANMIGYINSTLDWSNVPNIVPTDENKQIEIAWEAATTNQAVIYTQGYVLPNGF